MGHHSCPLSIIFSWKHTRTVCNISIHSSCAGMSMQSSTVQLVYSSLVIFFLLWPRGWGPLQRWDCFILHRINLYFWAVLKRWLAQWLDRFAPKWGTHIYTVWEDSGLYYKISCLNWATWYSQEDLIVRTLSEFLLSYRTHLVNRELFSFVITFVMHMYQINLFIMHCNSSIADWRQRNQMVH